ncbi:sensor histidine kinase [soil metagenome]
MSTPLNERLTGRRPAARRFGIRARLLALLLPCILGLLALDSWDDYRALSSLVQDSYDRVMLESVNALRGSVSVAADGTLQLDATAPLVQRMFDASSPQGKHLHVGLKPRGPVSGTDTLATERTLLGDADLPAPPSSASSPTAPAWYDGDYRGQPVRVVALRSQVVDGAGRPFDLLVQAAESTGARDLAEAVSRRQQLFRDARMVLVVVVLVWLGVTWSLRPLERLRRFVVRRKGQAPEPLDASGVPYEVAPLVDAVNQHVASYRKLLDQQSQFLADASHQLRTPLAIMLTQAGVALREKDPKQLHDTLRAMVAQISRSRRLCEQLLSLAHASDSSVHSDDGPAFADLNAIAKDVVLQYLTLAHEKNQDLGWVDAHELAREQGSPRPAGTDGADGMAVPVRGNAPELHEALSNLVHNAIVYTPAGGNITVAASIAGGMALAEVRDDGPGIASARRAEVFERFSQVGGGSGTAGGIGTSSRGAGLGLAIARASAQRNGGDLVLTSADGDIAGEALGLRAVRQVPLADTRQG